MNKRKARHEVPLPPITNRGVTRTKDGEAVTCTDNVYLSVMLDWCQITVKGVTPEVIAEQILRIPYWLMDNDFRGGLKGGYHALMCYDDIRVFEPGGKNKENGYQILMAGKGCRNFEKFLEANNETWYDFFERLAGYDINYPRIDIAIDDRKTYFKIEKLARLARENLVVTRLRIGDSHVGFDLNGNRKRGDTLYIGSRASEFYMCFYEKGYEQCEKMGKELDKRWNRYELRFRQKRAMNLVNVLRKRRDVSGVVMEVLNESIRFVKKPEGSADTNIRRWPLWEPWAWFMHDAGKMKLTIKPEEKDYYERLNWLKQSVMPTLKTYMKIDEFLGTTVIEDALRKTKLDKKHLYIIESCIRQLQKEGEIFQKGQERAVSAYELQKCGFVSVDGFKNLPFEDEG